MTELLIFIIGLILGYYARTILLKLSELSEKIDIRKVDTGPVTPVRADPNAPIVLSGSGRVMQRKPKDIARENLENALK